MRSIFRFDANETYPTTVRGQLQVKTTSFERLGLHNVCTNIGR